MADQKASLDTILEKYLGGAGLFQLLATFAMMFVKYGSIMPLFLTVFTAYEPSHRCYVPGCESLNGSKVINNIFNHSWLELALPPEKSSSNFLAVGRQFDGCKMYNFANSSSRIDELFCENNITFRGNLSTISCNKYIYDNTYFDETVVTKFDLICENEYKKSFLGTVLIIGLLFGSLLGGFIGDKFGRKTANFLALAAIVPFTIGAGHVHSYEAYACLHFLTMVCLPILWVNYFAYMVEILPLKLRHIFPAVFSMPFDFYLFDLIAYMNRTWTGIHIWVGITIALILPLYLILPESPRWLAQNQKEEEAFRVLLKIAKVNGKKLNENDQTKIKDIIKTISEESIQPDDNPQKKLYPWHMFLGGQAIKSLILIFAWITVCISYYALSLNSADLEGNIFETFFYARSSNWGALVWYGLSTSFFGRKTSLILSHTTLGISCIILAFIPKEMDYAILVVYFVAILAAGVSFNMVYIMTSESYPTNLRTQACGSASAISRIFCACAPFLGKLAQYYKPLPMLVIGVPILISGALVLKLPETNNKELPPTMREAAAIDSNENISMNSFNKGTSNIAFNKQE